MKTQYENTAILLIIKGGGGRVSLDGVTACGLVKREGPSDISYRVAKGVFWPVFGTATLSTGASVASSHGEGVF